MQKWARVGNIQSKMGSPVIFSLFFCIGRFFLCGFPPIFRLPRHFFPLKLRNCSKFPEGFFSMLKLMSKSFLWAWQKPSSVSHNPGDALPAVHDGEPATPPNALTSEDASSADEAEAPLPVGRAEQRSAFCHRASCRGSRWMGGGGVLWYAGHSQGLI